MEPADSVEKTLGRLIPRGMSEEGSRALEAMIDELSAEAPSPPDWLRIGVWSTGGMAAAVALAVGLTRPVPPAATAAGLPLERPQVELMSVVEGVMSVDPVENLVAESDGSLHREWRMQVVTEEHFHDAETGHDVRVVHPRDEIVMVPVTSF